MNHIFHSISKLFENLDPKTGAGAGIGSGLLFNFIRLNMVQISNGINPLVNQFFVLISYLAIIFGFLSALFATLNGIHTWRKDKIADAKERSKNLKNG